MYSKYITLGLIEVKMSLFVYACILIPYYVWSNSAERKRNYDNDSRIYSKDIIIIL